MEDKMLIFENPEKRNNVRLGIEEYMPNSGSRILLSGMPGSGKRNVILNIIHRMIPKPSCCHIVHCDPYTTEYNCIAQMGIPIYIYDCENFPTLANIENPDNEEIENLDENNSENENIINQDSNKEILNFPLVIFD